MRLAMPSKIARFNPLKALLHRSIRRFETHYGYDATYMHAVADASPSAAVRLSMMPLVSQYQGAKDGPKERLDVWAGAAFASTQEGGCGACAQLIINMAREAGVETARLAACQEGDWARAGAAGLGYRFASGVIAADPEVEPLRREILDAFGAQTLIAASFAAASGRWYPVVKRGLGETMSCEPLVFDAPVAGAATA